MMGWITSWKRVLPSLIVILGASAAPSAWAQEQDAGFINVRVIQVKPDRIAEWEELQKEMSAAMKKAGATRHIWQVARGGIDTYHIVTYVSELGANDEPAENPLGATRFAAWAGRVGQCVGDRQVLVLRRYPDLTIPMKDGATPNLMLLALRTTEPDGRTEYADYLRDQFVPALKKAKVDGFYVSRVFAGDSPDTWVVANMVDKWSDFDTPHPIIETLGQEAGAKVFAGLSPMMERRENVLLSYREDLSALP